MSFRGSISLLIVGFLPGIVHAESGRLSPIAMAAQQRFVQAAYREHLAPRAVTFKLRAIELKSALDAMCPAPNAESLQTARRAWTGTMLAWESAGAILAGPLLARHTAANIDFWPTRPGMIEFAMRSPPADVTALRRTGVAGRGLPALEWLLWGPGE